MFLFISIPLLDTGTRCANLVEEDTTKAFFQLLVRESKNDISDEFVLQVHHVLSKLALKGGVVLSR